VIIVSAVLVLSCRQTNRHTHTHRQTDTHTQTDTDERFTPVTLVGVSETTINIIGCKPATWWDMCSIKSQSCAEDPRWQ